MRTITESELIVLLNDVKSSTFTNVVTETKVRMNKKGNPFFDKVIKRSSCNYLMGNNYEDRVDTNYGKEGLEQNFQVEKPSGKHHISKVVLESDRKFKEVDGVEVEIPTERKFYLMVERFDEIKPVNEYKMEGDPIEKMMFESYMVKVSESQKQEQERKVMVITPLISNIREISFGGKKYIITPDLVEVENEVENMVEV